MLCINKLLDERDGMGGDMNTDTVVREVLGPTGVSKSIALADYRLYW